jgi:energy-coupling factor transporter ATP-binding protein EcfA2
MVHLIGLSGKRGSGKDTVARLLQQLQPERHWQIMSFGDAIKAVCATLAGEETTPYYSQRGKAEMLPDFGRTRGEMLQQVGAALRSWDYEIWVKAFFARLPADQFILVPDVRFPNEAQPILDRGGLMLRVEGDPLRQQGDGTRDDTHPSETVMDTYAQFSAVLHNVGSREALRHQVAQQVLPLLR